MKITFSFSVILIFLVNSLQAQDSTRTQLFYGPNNAYYLTAPTGWVMDNEVGKEQGMTAVFYPEGSNWVDGETVMYTTFANYDSTKNETLKEFILNDSIRFKQNSFKPTISRQKSIVIGKEKKAIVYTFSDHDNKHYEMIAYMGESKGVVMVVMTSTNKNGCINNYKSFQSLVKSYRFLTDKVNIQIGK
jgi:hypothetical protein